MNTSKLNIIRSNFSFNKGQQNVATVVEASDDSLKARGNAIAKQVSESTGTDLSGASTAEHPQEMDVQPAKFMLYDSLFFQVHETTGQLMVVVKDVETGDVIKTVPPQDLLDTLGRIKSAIGAIVDKRG